MANMLNNYFSQIGQKLAANIEQPNSANILSSTLFITQRCTSFYLQPITESDILEYIRQLNPSKSTGPDGIPLKYITMSALIIAPVLTRLYNSCISTGTNPILKVDKFLKLDKLYQFIRVMPRISAAITDPYLYLAHLVRSLKNACTKEFTLI